MIDTSRPRASFPLAGLTLIIAAGFALYSQWFDIIRTLNSARNVVAIANEAIEVKKDVREATAKVELNRQQTAELLRLVREVQRSVSRKNTADCVQQRIPY